MGTVAASPWRRAARPLAIGIVLVASGCWWMKDSYTEKMEQTLRGGQAEQELAQYLGDTFRSSEFGLTIRPPRPTQAVTPAAGVIAQFRGDSPPIEVFVIGNAAGGSMQDFMNSALAKLNEVAQGPAAPPQKQEGSVINSRSGGALKHELYAVQAPRTVAGAGGASSQVQYFWYAYFVDAAPKQILVAFVFPQSKYAEFSEAMVKSMETLSLGAP